MEEYGRLILKTISVYIFVLIALRMMGKREIGKLSLFDIVVYIMIAEVAAVSLDLEEPLLRGVIIVSLLVSMQVLVSFLNLKSHRLRQLIEGQPSFIIKNGKINDSAMRSSRYTMSDLLTQLREKNIASVSDVEVAVLETTGKLSVFPKDEKHPVTKEDLGLQAADFFLPIALIVDGKVMVKNLLELHKDEQWLKEQIQHYGYRKPEEIFFCSIDAKGRLYFDTKEHDLGK